MQNILIVVDMQNDFIDGALGTAEAVQIVPRVKKRIEDFDGKVIFTRDTHEENYLSTQEGRNLPVEHCIRGTKGWEIHPELEMLRHGTGTGCRLAMPETIDKVTFGSSELPEVLKRLDQEDAVQSITLIGLCTDICVISNAMVIKAFFPEVEVLVDASCCAGVTPQSHQTALEAMKMCQIKVI